MSRFQLVCSFCSFLQVLQSSDIMSSISISIIYVRFCHAGTHIALLLINCTITIVIIIFTIIIKMVNIIIVNTTRHFQLLLVQSLSGAPLVSPSDPLGTVTPPQYRTLLVLIWHKSCYSYAHMAHLIVKG